MRRPDNRTRWILLLTALLLGFIATTWTAHATAAAPAAAGVPATAGLTAGGRAGLFQATEEPVETATPLPTLADIGEGSSGTGNWAIFGLILVCGMGILLVAGVGAAILLFKLRQKIG